jgi:hypothetical protein
MASALVTRGGMAPIAFFSNDMPRSYKEKYNLKRNSQQILLKIVTTDEQKRDNGQITLKIVANGVRTERKRARALRWQKKFGFSQSFAKNKFLLPMAQRH